jgi:uncharacterized peroxidase-related enzyme
MNSEFASDVGQLEALERRRAAPSSTNLSLVDEGTANGEVRSSFAHYRERFGQTDLPGIVLCFATNSSLLKGMLEIAENFLFCESLLSRRHKEMIAVYVSQQNACPYCADSHGALLRAQGGLPEMVSALQRDDLNTHLFTSAEAALLKFAGKVNANSSAVIHDDVEAAVCAGWTEPQVAEAVHVVALYAAFNRIASGFGLPSPYPDSLRDQL